MKHFLQLSIAAAMTMATATLAHADDLLFELANETSVPLVELFISPNSLPDWEDDVLGSDVVMPGEVVDVLIADGRRDCVYDILGVFADDDEVEDYQVDLCELESYTFYEE
jgi:hypothetical protein